MTGIFADETESASKENVSPAPKIKLEQNEIAAAPKVSIIKKPFSPFTGRIKASKVRLRLQPDLESRIVREMKKNEYVSVVDEEGDFLAIEAPLGVKAYVFRSFVLDNVVEGNRVNVRLEPSLESPIIAHLNTGDKVKGVVSEQHNKWLEIPVPSQTRFFISKEFVEFIGGPEMKAQMDKRRNAVDQLLESASLLCKAEMNKSFEEIDFERLKRSYQTIIQDYTDFPEQVDKAREFLATLQETYLQKRIAYLEAKASSTMHQEESNLLEAAKAVQKDELNDRMKTWEPIEEALYLTWTQFNQEKNIEEYYDQEKLLAVPISGILEAYISPVKNKPGDFIMRENDLPVAYVYSTKIDLQNYVGKKVTLIGSPRTNNNFAFPAYFIHAIE